MLNELATGVNFGATGLRLPRSQFDVLKACFGRKRTFVSV